ncbi:MAG TPA: penicillin-binding protein 1C [Candidatus Polarisedimenticolia bacterium]|nr:penicillin-binding protein 1C [Candidatus Polarisedimenticolia bacterium]
MTREGDARGCGRPRGAGRLRRAGLLAAALLGLPLAALALAVRFAAPDPRLLLSRAPEVSLEIVDRHGESLRSLPDEEGGRFRRVDAGHLSPHLVQAVLAAEDRRFLLHPGVDPLALARAAWQDLRAGRVVSGASTITMQLAHLLDPRPRGPRAKVAQILLALRLERVLGKEAILAEYLSRAPMGNRIIGFEAAANLYLGKPASQLSPAEAALLASVPRSPSVANPWKGEEALRARRDAVLRRMARGGFLDDASCRAALAEPIVLARQPFRLEAPHFLRRLEQEVGPPPEGAVRVAATLDLGLQKRVEAIARQRLRDLAEHGVHQTAIVVLDVERGEWLAIEGSGVDLDQPGGAIDGSRAPRQPGSALKPFTYAAAFDRGFTPATVLPDLPHAFVWRTGTWTPRNYDERYHGPLRARQALACSVNVPAAFLLHALGPPALLETLRRAGLTTLRDDPDLYGLGLTLGAGEVRLDELTLAYAALLRGGEWRGASSWRAILGPGGEVLARPRPGAPRRVCSREAAAQVVDILADPEARAAAFGPWSVLRLPFAAAVKTGTSEGFRDNWCVGGTREVVVGVWCGNFDRAPMGNVSGVSGAGTIWREVMLAWAELARNGQDLATQDTLGPPPPGLARLSLCALSGLVPSPACPITVSELLRPGQRPVARCDWHSAAPDGTPSIAWPPLYRDWAAHEGLLAVAAPDPSGGDAGRPYAPAESGARALLDPTRGLPLSVVTPAHGDAYVIVPDLPRRFQTLELRCSVRGAPGEVVWLVDGAEAARVPPPYSTSWTLRPGTHSIEAAAGALRSEPVTITVYGGG